MTSRHRIYAPEFRRKYPITSKTEEALIMTLLERKLIKKYFIIALCWLAVTYWPIWCFGERMIWGISALLVQLPLCLYFFYATNWLIPVRCNYFKIARGFTKEQRQYISEQCLDCTYGKPQIGNVVFTDDLIVFINNGRALRYQDVQNITLAHKRMGQFHQKGYCHIVTFHTDTRKFSIRVYNQKWLFEGEQCAFARAIQFFNSKQD